MLVQAPRRSGAGRFAFSQVNQQTQPETRRPLVAKGPSCRSEERCCFKPNVSQSSKPNGYAAYITGEVSALRVASHRRLAGSRGTGAEGTWERENKGATSGC